MAVLEALELVTASGWRQWAGLVTLCALSGLAIYFAIGGWLYWRYYVRSPELASEWKCQPRRWLSAKQHRWAIRVAATNMAIGGLLSGTFAYWVLNGGHTALYFDLSEHGLVYTLVSTVGMFIALEAAAYYTHRFLHRPWMFRHVHRWHHRCVAPTPFTATTMHPVEFISFQITAFLPVFVLPVHAVSFIALLVYVLVFNIKDHSGIKLGSPLPWQSSSAFHDDHHVHFHCNYGQNLKLFDRLHGTMRRRNRRYGEHVFGGKGAPVDAATDDDDFVEYE